mmetsp:Transcript_13509/g.27414  ORF Transcript_13509/g.27414 Transcript_13509/m.27414 type:complete len:202 (-) Transcript_13509:434-1039(-)
MKAGVPLVRARLEVQRLVDLNCVPDVVVAEVWHTGDDITLVHNALHAQVLLAFHELCKRLVTYLGAAEVDHVHVAIAVVRERESRSEQHAQGTAQRVASHVELGFFRIVEQFFHLLEEGRLEHTAYHVLRHIVVVVVIKEVRHLTIVLAMKATVHLAARVVVGLVLRPGEVRLEDADVGHDVNELVRLSSTEDDRAAILLR